MQRVARYKVVFGRRLVVGPAHLSRSSVFSRDDRCFSAFQDDLGGDAHLLAAVNEALLNRGDALLLFDLFLDLRDLSYKALSVSVYQVIRCISLYDVVGGS